MMELPVPSQEMPQTVDGQVHFKLDASSSNLAGRRSLTRQSNDVSSPEGNVQDASEEEAPYAPKKRGRKPRPDAAERRKVQNRRAQKTFRERKKAKAQNLEVMADTLQTSVGAAFSIIEVLAQENNELIQRIGGTRPAVTVEKLIQGTPLAELYPTHKNGTASYSADHDSGSATELLAPFTRAFSSGDFSSSATSEPSFSSQQSNACEMMSPIVDATPSLYPSLCTADSFTNTFDNATITTSREPSASTAQYPNDFPAAPFSFPLGSQLQGIEEIWPAQTASAFAFDPALVPTPNAQQLTSMSWPEDMNFAEA